jgi:predicted phage terminase large subunit-like protein
MQRLHEKDLSGHVLRQGDYEHLRLPSEFEPKKRAITYAHKRTGRTITTEVENEKGEVEEVEEPERKRVLFFRDPRTKPGQLLFPKLYTPAVLAQARKDLRDAYSGQHDQDPAPAEGVMFLKKWWRFWKPDGTDAAGVFVRPDGCRTAEEVPAKPLPDKFDRVLISLDAAFKDGKKNDRVAFAVIGVKKADKYILEVVARRMSFTNTIVEFKRLVTKYPKARLKLVEDKANGSAIIDTLRSEIAGIVAVEPEGGKEARASAMQPEVEGGNVYIAEGAEWVVDFVAEFAVFPLGTHDDRVDAVSQAIIYLASSPAVAAAKGMANI